MSAMNLEGMAREFIKSAELDGKGWDTERLLTALLRRVREAALEEAARIFDEPVERLGPINRAWAAAQIRALSRGEGRQ